MKVINVKGISPRFNRILTTKDVYEDDLMIGNVHYPTKGHLKELQKVVAIGDSIRGIKVGDIVKINPSNYAKKIYDPNSIKEDMGMNKVATYNFNIVEMDGKEYLLFYDSDIEYIVTDYEEVENGGIKEIQNTVKKNAKKLIIPEVQL